MRCSLNIAHPNLFLFQCPAYFISDITTHPGDQAVNLTITWHSSPLYLVSNKSSFCGSSSSSISLEHFLSPITTSLTAVLTFSYLDEVNFMSGVSASTVMPPQAGVIFCVNFRSDHIYTSCHLRSAEPVSQCPSYWEAHPNSWKPCLYYKVVSFLLLVHGSLNEG